MSIDPTSVLFQHSIASLRIARAAALPAEPWDCAGQDGNFIRDETVTLPFERTLRARAGRVAMLVVEERGEPLELWLAEDGAPAHLLDLPPDGREARTRTDW